MGKSGRNEMKRVAANFLNGAAVALLMAGYLGPLMAGDNRIWIAVLAIFSSMATHSMAVRLVSDLED